MIYFLVGTNDWSEEKDEKEEEKKWSDEKAIEEARNVGD